MQTTLSQPRLERKEGGLNLRDFCYSHFRPLGSRLSSLFRSTESDLEAAYMRIHPEVYYSIVAFAALLSLIFPTTLLILHFLGATLMVPLPGPG
ncbi:MAG: hypothetical protein QXI32_06175, partial [Candidatus Bathyarchaeia archaeon]